jgi:hypothetical protein
VGTTQGLRKHGRGATSARSVSDNGHNNREGGKSMRAEIQSLVEEIKQSLGLLRRHL